MYIADNMFMKKRNRIKLIWMLLMVLLLSGCNDFDAEGYVQAALDAVFQGETDALMALKDGSKKRELEQEYEDRIAEFAEGLTIGLEVSEPMQIQFNVLCENIFRTMRYSVETAEKSSKNVYKVTVEYVPSDVFVKWTEYMAENAEDLNERAQAGEYQGTEEEIWEQMRLDIATESLELLDTAMMNAAYGEEKQTVLSVKKGEDGEFAMDEAEIADFIAKILYLDEIQD